MTSRKAERLIVGIDPATERVGFCVLDPRTKGKVRRLEVIHLKGRLHFRLHWLRCEMDSRFAELKGDGRPVDVAIEKAIVWGGNIASLNFAEARGVILASAVGVGARIHEYHASQVKKGVTGNGRATKSKVARMVQATLNLVDEPAWDAGDAAALAIYHEGTRHDLGEAVPF